MITSIKDGSMRSLDFHKILVPSFFFIGLTILAYMFQSNLNETITDWSRCYRPGVYHLLSNNNPYFIPECHYMPWSLIFLIPFALFPTEIGQSLLSASAIFVLWFAARQMGANKFGLFALILNPFYLLHHIQNPNIDWLVAVGFILPPQIGLIFVLIKPQLGLGISLYWFVRALERGGAREVVRIFAPIVSILILSFSLFGPEILNSTQLIKQHTVWNLTLWPYSIPIGITLLFLSFVNRSNKGAAILSAPFLSPYVGFYSWSISLLGLIPRHQYVIITTFILSWLVPIIYFLILK